jgi:hypothetical protein
LVGVEKPNLKLTSGVDDPFIRASGTITVNQPFMGRGMWP